ncbi:MAG: hypothetical protein AW09_001335 [Candidatus Accumulibacter phosphatis]|uniref:Uncharacterized protein n=1 Tax=Candidatus Accumulibacter phosphatis TaxID=327160 RepID=A0A080M8F2_9PROT|nr:MAG: hypothetical protein AW09_001335 [Candidatus Accumulibacter phosphatis]
MAPCSPTLAAASPVPSVMTAIQPRAPAQPARKQGVRTRLARAPQTREASPPSSAHCPLAKRSLPQPGRSRRLFLPATCAVRPRPAASGQEVPASAVSRLLVPAQTWPLQQAGQKVPRPVWQPASPAANRAGLDRPGTVPNSAPVPGQQSLQQVCRPHCSRRSGSAACAEKERSFRSGR